MGTVNKDLITESANLPNPKSNLKVSSFYENQIAVIFNLISTKIEAFGSFVIAPNYNFTFKCVDCGKVFKSKPSHIWIKKTILKAMQWKVV